MNNVQTPPGTTIRVWHGGYWHYGILVHGGHVIHNSKQHKRVVEESLHHFSDGRRVEVCSDIASSDLRLACIRAKQLVGQMYLLFTQNCEHFVRVVHGLVPESPQIQRAVLASSGLALVALTDNPKVQLVAASAAVASLLTPKGGSPVAGAFWGAAIAGVVSLAI